MSVAHEGQQSDLSRFGDVPEPEAPPHGGGRRAGLAAVLTEIDPSTLPDGDPWDEVRRRIVAYEAGRDGWRTGEIQSTLDEAAGGEDL